MSHELNLQANERFRKVAMERAVGWYEIARELCGESITNCSLYLITGFHKARTWSLASFCDTTAPEPRHIEVVPRDDKGTIVGRLWKHTFPVDYRNGPEDYNGNINQCVFISGFKIAVRDDVFGWLYLEPDVRPVPTARLPQVPSCPARFLSLLCRKDALKRRHRANARVDVKPVPPLSQVGAIGQLQVSR